jgi:hypothetical protein
LNRSFCSETTFKTHSFPQFPAPAANASGFVQKDSIESPQTYLRFEAFLYAGASDRILISYQNPWNGAHGGRRRSDPEILLRMAAYPSYPLQNKGNISWHDARERRAFIQFPLISELPVPGPGDICACFFV